MNAITLKHLRYFHALAQTRHFAQAAEACAISQPALSLQIKQLEELAGAPLVERTTRSVHLTSLGEQIARQAEAVLRLVADISETVRAAKAELAGPFRLGVIPTIAPYLLPDALARIGERFPELDVVVRETKTASIVEELQAGSLDAAIVALPITEAALHHDVLFSERFVLVRPSAHAGRPVPNVAALQKMKLLLLQDGHCFRDQALEFCKLDGASRTNILEGNSLTTLVQLVSSGVGVTLIPQMAARIEAKAADVDIVAFDAPEPTRTIGMVWRKTSPLGPHLATLSAVVREAAREAGAAA